MAFDLADRRGEVGGAYQHIYSGLTLQSPARYTALPGLKLKHPREYITVPEYRAYLEKYAAHHGLQPRRAEITGIVRSDRSFVVQFGVEPGRRYAAVAVATGMYDSPIWPAIPGLARQNEGVIHARVWTGPSDFTGKRMLVLGGATSAVEIAAECATHGLPIVMSTRSGVKVSSPRFLGRDVHDYAHIASHLLPRWLAGPYCEHRPTLPGSDLGFTRLQREGKIEVFGPVKRFDGKTAIFPDGRREKFDVVIAATGYRFEMPFLPTEVIRTPAGHPLADDGESRAWPGLFFIGVPCCRTLVSEFLRGIAKDAPAIAERIANRSQESGVRSQGIHV